MDYNDLSLAYSGSLYHGKFHNRNNGEAKKYDLRKFLRDEAKKEREKKALLSLFTDLGLEIPPESSLKGRPEDLDSCMTVFSRLLISNEAEDKSPVLLPLFLEHEKDVLQDYVAKETLYIHEGKSTKNAVYQKVLISLMLCGCAKGQYFASEFLSAYCKEYFTQAFEDAKRVSGSNLNEFVSLLHEENDSGTINNLEHTLRVLILKELASFVHAPDDVYNYIYTPYAMLIMKNNEEQKGLSVKYLTELIKDTHIPQTPIAGFGFTAKEDKTLAPAEKETAAEKDPPDNTAKYKKELETLKKQLKNKNNKIAKQASFIESLEEKNAALQEELKIKSQPTQTENTEDLSPVIETAVPEEVDTSELIEKIGERKVTVVGGLKSWVDQMKIIFPNWKFIKPGDVTSNMIQIVGNTDALFIYTNHVDHVTTGKYKKCAIEKGIPYGFINYTNKEKLAKEVSGYFTKWDKENDKEKKDEK